MPSTERPLLITADQDLIDEVIAIATSRAIEMRVEGSLALARPLWLSAPAILVGPDVLAECEATSLPRRVAVAVVATDNNTDTSERHMWRAAVHLGAENVMLVPTNSANVAEMLSVSLEGPARFGRIVTLSAGSGGAGASTVSLALAQLAVKAGIKTLLIDADPFGGGLDLLAGIEDGEGIRWGALLDAHGRVAAPAFEAGLVNVGGASLLSFGRDEFAIPDSAISASVLDTATRVFDLVIIDCGRDTFSDVFIARSHLNLVIVRNHVRATAAAAARLRQLQKGSAETKVLIARDAHGIDADSIARALGVTEVAVLPFLPGMAVRADDGDGIGIPNIYRDALAHIIELINAKDAAAA
jgi:secretion/DNA translocation related CpaE-like protein